MLWSREALSVERMMKISGVICKSTTVEKLLSKHRVSVGEVREVFCLAPIYRFVERGHVQGEDLYAAMGRAASGRLLTVYFIYKVDQTALVLSARDMTRRERRLYGRA